MERIFLRRLSTIPPSGDEAEKAFRFYYNIWKRGYFRDFSFRHLPNNNRSSLSSELENGIKGFLYTHFIIKALPTDIKNIFSNPKWYNSWGVREALGELMDTNLPLRIYEDLQIYEEAKKNSRFKAVLLEWGLFDRIQKMKERRLEERRAVIASLRAQQHS